MEEELGRICLAVEIPEGAKVRITRRDIERTREMAETMTRELRDAQNANLSLFQLQWTGS